MPRLIKRKFFLSLLFAVVCGGLWLGVGQVLAQTAPDLGLAQVGEGIGLPATDIRLIVARIIRAALGLLGIIALLLVLYAGYLWMTAGGNEEKVATAKKILFNAVIGLIIILSAYAIVSFVMSKLLSATTGVPEHCYNGVMDEGETGVDCGGECPSCSGAISPYGASNVFYVKQKPSGYVCIRNYYPLVVFNHEVNLATLENNLIVREKDNQNEAGGEWQFASESAKNIVKFIPDGDCGSPPNDCLAASTTYELVFVNPNEIKSQEDLVLNCNLDAKCDTSEFTTGESVDRQPPIVSITSPADSSHLEKGTNVEVNVSYWDDNGVQNISLFDNGWYVDSASVSDCQQTGSVSINWPTAAAVIATHTLEVIGFDWSAATGTDGVMVWLKPGHCFNNIQDEDEGETGIDCGGECGFCGGSGCTDNSQCASGYCENGVCVNRAIITQIQPLSGAASTTYVTISGRYFGDDGGRVYFTKFGGGWTEAPVLGCGSGIDNWTQAQIVVSVPNDAAHGPLRLETASTSQHDSFIDDTNDDWGIKADFEVTDQQRPGLCNIQPKFGPPYTTNVNLQGINFGTQENKVIFGSGSGAFNALIKNWSNQLINAKVPGMAPGTVSVKVAAELGGEELESNGLAFYINEEIGANTPIIQSIFPDHGANGQYITIIGKNFGSNKGMVYFKLDGVGNGIPGNFDFPAECENTVWKDNQVIVKFPDDASYENHKYSVQVQRSSDDALSPIGAYFMLEAGSPGPGICKIDPTSGPVPFVEGNFMKIVGDYFFSPSPSWVCFWGEDASSSTIDGRFCVQAEEGDLTPQKIWVSPDPETKTGPVVAYRPGPGEGKMSNSLNFTVFNCLENNNTCAVAENKCCLQGAEAGICKLPNELCEGESRSTGYMWRFGTRDLPVVPRVIERCNDGTDAGENIPSPAPNAVWNTNNNFDHTNVCRTALVTIAFNTELDPLTVGPETVQIFKCVSTTLNNNCDNDGKESINLDLASYNLHNDNSSLSNGFYLALEPSGSVWDDNTWYQVVLSSGIISSGTFPGPLQATRPCGEGTAYCFVFKTDEIDCRLAKVVVTPLNYWTSILERPIRYRKVKDNADDFGADLYYRGNGLSEQHCVWMNMDDYSWDWSVSNGIYSDIYSVKPPPDDNEAQVSALANTVAVGLENDAVLVQTTASRVTTTIEETIEEVSGASPLHIDLSRPKVIDYWPNCLEACTNAAIGAKFNTIMADHNLENGVHLYKCNDENCYDADEIGIQAEFIENDRRYLNISFNEITYELKQNTIYKVVLSANGTSTDDGLSQLWSGASTTNATIISKPYQQEFSWRFRTKKDKCQPNRVNVIPSVFTAFHIKDRAVYGTEVFSSPDACDPDGQRLNPWTMDWEWNSSDDSVAAIQMFETKGRNNLCTAKCLKRGSDILWGAPAIEPVCGNSVVEAGEDCDPPLYNSLFSITSCGLNCLYPGNASTTCGDGIVDVKYGEECDPQHPSTSTAQGCGDDCLRTGSSQSPGAEEVEASICGNGLLGAGEDCDLGIEPDRLVATSSLRCSENCLHLGTTLAAKWCYDNADDYMGFEQSVFRNACKKTLSQCGDGIVSPNEECDPGAVVSSTCSMNCLLLSNCTPTSTDEGCTADGQLAGSSLMYSVPSICGDGNVGIGESADCEQGFVVSHTFINPWVLVTGVGYGATTGTPPTQQAAITGQEQSFFNSNSGQFIIPCGYYSDEECNLTYGNNFGVAYNSCCYKRPWRVSTYPTQFSNVCPNTYIEIVFDKKIDESTLAGNLLVAQGRDAESCLSGESDVSGMLVSAEQSEAWYKKAWKKFVAFIKNLFTTHKASAVIKTSISSSIWCADSNVGIPEVSYDLNTSTINSVDTTTTIFVRLTTPLATGTDYAVILKSGIKDIRGVSIKNYPWVFITGEKICELEKVSIDPDKYLYQRAGDSAIFEAEALTLDEQQIQPVTGYEWEYIWEPMTNDYLTLSNTTSTLNTMTAKNHNGELDVVAITNFTENIFSDNSPQLRGSSHVTIFLCENPWPSAESLPWRDDDFDFSTYYCRDSGSFGPADDLPGLATTTVDNPIGPDKPYLRRYLLTSKDTSDAVGVIVFANLQHLSVEDWFASKQFMGNFRSLKIDGYSAITDGNNYYIDVLNEAKKNIYSDGDIYSNIYLFSINSDAGTEMRHVFEQMITNLKFNNDLLNERYCGNEFEAESINYDLSCDNDQDCFAKVEEYNKNTDLPIADYWCLNQKDKLQRNYQRLKDLRFIMAGLSNYNQNQQVIISSTLNFYPLMKENTYLTGQALSVWPSAWNGLGGALGAIMPIDPINQLVQAGTCYQKNSDDQYDFCYKDEHCVKEMPISNRVSYWLAEQNAKDEAEISDGQLEGDISFASGIGHGQAFDFSGESDSKIVIPHNDAYSSEIFTLSLWIYARKKNTAVLFKKGGLDDDGNSLGGWQLEYSGWTFAGEDKKFNNGTLRFAIYPPTDSQLKYVAADSATPLALNQWHHIAAVYDGEVLQLYLNGQPVNLIEPSNWIIKGETKQGVVDDSPGEPQMQTNSLNLEMGQNFNGLIDNVMFYNNTLSAGDVQNLYNGLCILHDSQTGWSAENRRFSFACNPMSNAYRYIYKSDTRSFNLRAKIEEDGVNPTNWLQFTSEFVGEGENVFLDQYGICQAEYEISSPYSLICGDGVLGGEEDCDPPGKISYDISGCPWASASKKVCGSDCQWGLPSKVTCAEAIGAQCGDGKIQQQAGEVCDDGPLNGQNGRCNTTCSGITHTCGNYNKGENELCDPTFGLGHPPNVYTGWCVGGPYFILQTTPCNSIDDCFYGGECYKGTEVKYGLLQNNSCNWDCKSYGPYCGDGEVQTEWGENCEADESCTTMGQSGLKKCSPQCRHDNSQIAGLINFWNFNYIGISGAVFDSKLLKHGFCTPNSNCPSVVPGAHEGNLAFNFSDGAKYVQINDNNQDFILPQFTIETWVKPSAGNPYWTRILEKGGSGSGGGFALELFQIGDIDNYSCLVWDGDQSYSVNASPLASSNQWHHVACVFNGAPAGEGKYSGILSIYLDGVLKNTLNVAVLATTDYPLCFGARCTGDFVFKGIIDDVGFYDRVLPPEEIQEHYQSDGWYCTAGGEVSPYSTCGNGTVEEEEVCDMGEYNGVVCEPQPPYKSCTYCSADCNNVITKDVVCGNGVWDVSSGEICDFENLLSNVVRQFFWETDWCRECNQQCTYDNNINTEYSICVERGLGYCGDGEVNGWEDCEWPSAKYTAEEVFDEEINECPLGLNRPCCKYDEEGCTGCKWEECQVTL